MTIAPPPLKPAVHDVARKQIRGSTLLLLGRGGSLFLNLLTQILTVRYLTKLEYGVFAWAFAIVDSAALLCLLGLDKAVMRFAAIFHERGDEQKLHGTLLLTVAVAIGLSGLFCLGVFWGHDLIARQFAFDASSMAILLGLALLVPINAFGSITIAILNVVRGARALLFRKYLAAPSLKLVAVLAVVLLDGSLTQVAFAYLAAGVCGFLLDATILARIIKDDGRPLFSKRPVSVPAKDLLGYSVPLMSSDIMFLVRGSVIVILAAGLSGATAAAELRTILPLVRMNELVLMNFALIFIPLASRLLAGRRIAELEQLAQQSSTWVMVLCFPIFASCVLLSRPMLDLLFGPLYQSAAPALIVLTGAYFLDAVFGFSSRVLKVLGLVRIVVIQDIVSVLIGLAAGYVLIPSYGALGAAIAIAVSIVLLDMLRMITLHRQTEIQIFRKEFFKPLASTLFAGGTIVGLRIIGDPGWILGSLLVVLSSTFVLLVNRSSLRVDETFPELRRLKSLGHWITRKQNG